MSTPLPEGQHSPVSRASRGKSRGMPSMLAHSGTGQPGKAVLLAPQMDLYRNLCSLRVYPLANT